MPVTFPKLIEAIQKAAHAHGVDVLAPRLDMKPSSLYNVLNPWGDRSVTKLGLEQAIAIMHITGDLTALEIAAELLGCTVRPADSRVPDRETVAEESMDDAREMGRLVELMQQGAPATKVMAQAEVAIDEIRQTVTLYIQSGGNLTGQEAPRQ